MKLTHPFLNKICYTLSAFALAVTFNPAESVAATLTIQTNKLGTTPDVVGINFGHWFPGSNTRAWWSYCGASGGRIFISPSILEPTDSLAPVGDGVTDQASFVSRKAALRADPLNPAYINWNYITNQYETVDFAGSNHYKINSALREARQLGINILAQITGTATRFPIASSSDWAGKWEYWHHYYTQAFYLGREFDVQRFEMYNEPDAVPVTVADYFQRIQLASDAIQSAQADVNALYGKSLVPLILGPTTAGNAYSDYTGSYGDYCVNNRHLNYLGQIDLNWLNMHKYDYHEYDHTGDVYGSNLAQLNSLLTSGMAPDPRFPTTITEFDVHTGANFDAITNTMDAPIEYSKLGGICVELMSNLISEMYVFKFSQTARTTSGTVYPVQKNALHYVDSTNAPYNVGGISKAGEVWRLFYKAFAPGHDRLKTVSDTSTTSMEAHTSYDPIRRRYFVYAANVSSASVTINVDLTALNIPAANKILVEEVSESSYGSGKTWTNLSAGPILSTTQAGYTVLLYTIPLDPQQSEQIISASEDAQVKDGVNSGVNYGAATTMTARNDTATRDNRSAGLVKFQLPVLTRTNVQYAVLSLSASTVSATATAQAHVYGLDNNNWAQGTVTWTTAPNLLGNIAAGALIKNNFINDLGGTAHVVGQVVVSFPTASEKLIDVTDFIRNGTNSIVSFLTSQDPRWDTELPSQASGDTQIDGVKIVTSDGGSTGPRLRLVLNNSGTPTPPAVPTGLSATPGNAQVSLSWTASSGATSYNVKRSTVTGGPYTTIASPTVASYTDTTAVNGTTYYYVVSAVNAVGESANSTQVSATPCALPSVPTALSATGGNAQIVVNWAASSGATGYNISRAPASGGPYTQIASGVTTTSYTDTGLAAGTTYFYTVVAINACGNSASSAYIGAATIPATPTGLSATPGNAQVALTWTASTGASSYNVKRATVSGGPYTTIASPTTASYTDTTAVNGTTYYYAVSAVNNSGESANSTQVSATPTAPVVTNVHVKSITMSWVKSGSKYKTRAVVNVVNASGVAVNVATVTGDFTGSISNLGLMGATTSTGDATITSTTAITTGTVTFTVKNITGTNLNYDATANLVTSASITR
ncbi:MAG: DUF7594 domain-containing protein [Limisphaerales bacterium]